MNSTLNNRLKKLEASQPEKENSFAHLTDEELDDALYASCKSAHEIWGELDVQYSLMSIKCRKLYDDEPWLKMANHRISVFQGFLEFALKQNLPEEIISVFALGWRNVPVPEEDIELTLKALHDIDLGEETPWLKGYLEYSGVISEY